MVEIKLETAILTFMLMTKTSISPLLKKAISTTQKIPCERLEKEIKE